MPPVRPVRETFASYGSRQRDLMGKVHFANSTVHSPWTALRVRWVPLYCFPTLSLGAFAISPRPGVPSFPGCRLLCPIWLPAGPRSFVWVSPGLLPTLLHIPIRLSRVHNRGLKQDSVGGVFISLSHPLFAAPQSGAGYSRLTCISLLDITGTNVYRPLLSTLLNFGRLADIAGKVCQGRVSPKDFTTLHLVHHAISQPSAASWGLAFLAQRLSGPCCSHCEVARNA